jgi:hypothetical protein
LLADGDIVVGLDNFNECCDPVLKKARLTQWERNLRSWLSREALTALSEKIRRSRRQLRQLIDLDKVDLIITSISVLSGAISPLQFDRTIVRRSLGP